ncbi:MAG: endo-1,4-beta-xylanase [Chitinophagaceae bacterium]|nr:endo-1,4-beta-xylanase [Chitinophagaceae bacterium]
MLQKQLKFSVIVAIAFITARCTPAQTNETTLKDAFKNDFLIGTIMNAAQIEEKEPNAARLIPQEFSAVTPENVMKAIHIHPEWDKYNFDLPDKLVAYGKKHDIKINGHVLIWHSQLPPFVKTIENADSLKTFFENHITTVASRYDGKIASWDVVNEALDEDGAMRKTIFLEKLGPGYVVEAFRLAQKATPNTELYYNDFNIEESQKRAGAIKLIKEIQAAGVRIDGVGIQGHWHLGTLPFKEIEESIVEFAKLGIKVAFTEVDISVTPNVFAKNTADVNATAKDSSAKMNPYANGLPDSVQQRLTNDYVELFKILLRHKDAVSRITFWGLNDGQSWLNDWPIPGRTDYPLLFDRNFQPKDVYYKLIETATKKQ